MRKAQAPVTLSLVRAPELNKNEIAEFFGVSENDFESESLGRGRYNLTVDKIDTAIAMFTSISKNHVNYLLTIRY